MKRSFLKQLSPRGKLLIECDKLFRKILINERGAICQICGRAQEKLPFPLSAFHILEKKNYPRLRYSKNNVLIACWSPQYYNDSYCHNIWHHCGRSDPKSIKVENRIKELRGDNYREALVAMDKLYPKLTNFRLCNLIKAFEKLLEV